MYKRFPALFGADADTQPEADADGQEDAQGAEGFTAKWGWLAQVDAVAELTRETWGAVFGKRVIEFLTLVCYNIDKHNEIQRQYKEQLRKDNAKRN